MSILIMRAFVRLRELISSHQDLAARMEKLEANQDQHASVINILAEEIDNLNPGDIVYHEYFGKGVVFDNTDVRRIEVRFGTDMRFIDKAGCVSKKLMRKV